MLRSLSLFLSLFLSSTQENVVSLLFISIFPFLSYAFRFFLIFSAARSFLLKSYSFLKSVQTERTARNEKVSPSLPRALTTHTDPAPNFLERRFDRWIINLSTVFCLIPMKLGCSIIFNHRDEFFHLFLLSFFSFLFIIIYLYFYKAPRKFLQLTRNSY